MARRDPHATRARILAAAEELFADSGFAGTRIDAVAARSGANKRMIYHYFGGKEALFESVLRHRLAEAPWDGEGEIDIAAARLLAWEGLEWEQPVAADARAEALRRLTQGIAARLARGEPRAQGDAALLALILVSARLFPLVAPRYAALVVGDQADFQTRYRALLAKLADALAPLPVVPASKPRLTLRPKVSEAARA